MFAAPSVFWLGPLVIVLADCPGICCVNTTVQFHRFTALGEYFCPAEYVDVEPHVTSKTQCLLHCEATPSCRSIGFEEDTFKCIKCSKEEFLENDDDTGSPAKTMVYRRHEAMIGNFSYRVVLERKSWNDAKINCENMGGYLTSIKSNDEQEFLTSLIPGNYTFGFWVGGNGTAGDIDSFKWLDGTSVSAGYSNWDTNDVTKLEGSDCIKMMHLKGHQWKNKDCGQTYASFCKFG